MFQSFQFLRKNIIRNHFSNHYSIQSTKSTIVNLKTNGILSNVSKINNNTGLLRRNYSILSQYEKRDSESDDTMLVPRKRLSKDDTRKKPKLHYQKKAEGLLGEPAQTSSNYQQITTAPSEVLFSEHVEFEQPENPKSLTLAVVGIPNAGKSTLVNSIIGEEISIVTRKAQTTRTRVLGIKSYENAQFLFVDTPGVVSLTQQARRRRRLQKAITLTAKEAALEADMICVVVDAAKSFNKDLESFLIKLKEMQKEIAQERQAMLDIEESFEENSQLNNELQSNLEEKPEKTVENQDNIEESMSIADLLAEAEQTTKKSRKLIELDEPQYEIDIRNFPHEMATSNQTSTLDLGLTPPIVLIMNKCDLVDSERAQHKARLLCKTGLFNRVFFMSALKGKRVSKFFSFLLEIAPEREWQYAPETNTDMSKMEIVQDIIRGVLFNRMNQELPYQIEQKNIGWTRLKGGAIRIDQNLIVPNERHKKVLVGKQAKTIKQISIQSQEEIARRLGVPVYLFLVVKIASKND